MTNQPIHMPDRRLSATERDQPSTGRLLTLAGAAGPLYGFVGAVEALTRPGFSLAHHDLSLLSNGTFGWIHSTLLVVTGVLVIAGAVGIGRAAPGSVWGPRLLASTAPACAELGYFAPTR